MNKKLKILQCAPIDIEVSKNLKYAGTERIIDALNHAYHEAGHESYVTASGDSDLGEFGTLIPTVSKSLWATNHNGVERKMVRSDEAYQKHFNKTLEFALDNDVDILHYHPGKFLINSEEYKRRIEKIEEKGLPLIATIHEDIIPEKEQLYAEWRELQKQKRNLHFVCISSSHKNKYEKEAGIRVDDFIYNGLPLEKLPFKQKKQDYLLWLGRICPEKGVDLAVQTAIKTGKPLIIAGEVHDHYKQFYEEKVKPWISLTINDKNREKEEEIKNSILKKINNGEEVLDKGDIFFIGPVNDKQKAILYGNASAVLQPNRWEEPFGLVMIESMATGTPVIGTNTGAIPELVTNGKTGYVIDPEWINKKDHKLNEDHLVSEIITKLEKIKDIKPGNCRADMEQRFSKEIMAQNYLKFYNQVLNQK